MLSATMLLVNNTQEEPAGYAWCKYDNLDKRGITLKPTDAHNMVGASAESVAD